MVQPSNENPVLNLEIPEGVHYTRPQPAVQGLRQDETRPRDIAPAKQLLFESAERGNVQAVLNLLDSVSNEEKGIALCRAVENGHLDVAKCLVDAGACLEVPDHRGNTALHCATQLSQPLEIAQYLVKKCQYAGLRNPRAPDPAQYINLCNDDGSTALHTACARTSSTHGTELDELVRFLVNWGAKTYLKDKEGRNSSFLAFEAGRLSVMCSLLEKSYGIGEPIISRIAREAQLSQTNHQATIGGGLTKLHIAAALDAGKVVEQLLANGENPNLEDTEGMTAWQISCEQYERNVGFDAFSAFAFSEIARNLQRIVHELERGYFPHRHRWLFIRGSYKVRIFAVLRNAFKGRSDINLDVVYRCVARNFEQHHGQSRFLNFREPRCIFVDSTPSGKIVSDQTEGYIEPDPPEPPASSSDQPACLSEEPASSSDQPIDPPSHQSGNIFLSLVIPCFGFMPFTRIQEREKKYEELVECSQYCSAGSFQLDARKAFGVHLPLTLDEYCNPGLDQDVLDIRNKDQVISRYGKNKEQRKLERPKDKNVELKPKKLNKSKSNRPSEGYVPSSHGILTVQQLWLWKIYDTVITSYPEDTGCDQTDIFESWKDDIFDDRSYLTGQARCIGMFLSYVVDALNRPVFGTSEPILDIFEQSISMLNEEVRGYLKLPLDVDYMRIETEKRFFHDIGDIREELSMIKMVLLQQEEVWKDVISKMWPRYWKDERIVPPTNSRDYVDQFEWEIIARPQTQFLKFKARIERLDENAQRVENSISINLDLKQKHSSMKEAHSTAQMSTAVFGFTIITIIFTPLSFVLALFALPIEQFQKNQKESRWPGTGAYSTNYIGTWIATAEIVSIFITIVAMLAAVEFAMKDGRHVRKLWKRLNGESASESNTGGTPAAAQGGVDFAAPASAARSKLENCGAQKLGSVQEFFQPRREEGVKDVELGK